jgi:hypothetical protein
MIFRCGTGFSGLVRWGLHDLIRWCLTLSIVRASRAGRFGVGGYPLNWGNAVNGKLGPGADARWSSTSDRFNSSAVLW